MQSGATGHWEIHRLKTGATGLLGGPPVTNRCHRALGDPPVGNPVPQDVGGTTGWKPGPRDIEAAIALGLMVLAGVRRGVRGETWYGTVI